MSGHTHILIIRYSGCCGTGKIFMQKYYAHTIGERTDGDGDASKYIYIVWENMF